MDTYVRSYQWTMHLTISFAYLETPFQENLCVIRANVFLYPRWPDILSAWQAWAILSCSFLSLTYLTSNTW